MSLGDSIRSGAAWLFIGSSGRQILTFVFGIVLARLLAPEDFGTLLTIQVFTGLAGFVAGGGMGQALIRAKTATKEDYDIVFTLQLIFGILIYTLFFFAAPLFARWYNTPIYVDLLHLSALSFIFRPFVNLPSSMLSRAMRYKEQTGIGLITLLVSSAVSISMAYLGYGVWSLVWGGIVGAVVSASLLIHLSNWRPGLSLKFRRGREIARYGMLTSINDVICYLLNQTSIFILSRTLGPASVALYNKGESLAKMPNSFITESVYQVLFRAIATEQDNLDKCRYLFFRSITLVAVYATPFYIGLLWLAEPLIRGVYGAKWLESSAPLFILVFAWPFWLMDSMSGAVIAAKNWLHREVLVQASTLVVTILALLVGLTKGIEGVAYAIVASSIYRALYIHWLAISCLQARWIGYIRALTPAVILNFILAIILFALDHVLPESVRSKDMVYLAIMGGSGGIIYALCFLYLPMGVLRTEQQRWKAKLNRTCSLTQ